MPDDPQASLRAELLGRLFAARAELESAVAELRAAGDAAGASSGETHIANLAALQRDVTLADAPALKGMRSEIIAFAVNVAADIQRAREGAAAAKAQHERHLAEVREESRKQVQAVMAGMRDFDPYLHFASPEDEKEYRKREADRRVYFDRETAKGTAQGDLNAVDAAIAQMTDAAEHGAKDSPEFADRFATLSKARSDLEESIGRSRASVPTEPKVSASTTDAHDLDSALAALRASGVQAGDASAITLTRRASAAGEAITSSRA